MYLGVDADGMAVLGQGTSFCDMVAFFIDGLCIRTLRAIPDKAGGFELIPVRLHHITAIDMDDRLGRDLSTDSGQIRPQGLGRDPFIQMPVGR